MIEKAILVSRFKKLVYLVLVCCACSANAKLSTILSFFAFSAELKHEADDLFNIGNAMTDVDAFLTGNFYYHSKFFNYLINIDFNDEYLPTQMALGFGKSFGQFDVNTILQKRQFLYSADLGVVNPTGYDEVPIYQLGLTGYWQYEYQLAHIGASTGLLYGGSPSVENQHLVISTITNFRYLYVEKYKYENVLSYPFAIELGLKLAKFKTKATIFFYEYTYRADSFNFINIIDKQESRFGNESLFKKIDSKNTYLQNQSRIGFILQ